jgi:hypothetical protein
LDDYKRREVCALVAAGCGIGGAAQYVGCAATTIRREALRNDDFHEQLRRAELSSQLSPLQAMQKAAATHWRAAAWLLERTGPERFTKRDPERMTIEQAKELIDQLIEAMVEEIDDPDTRRKVHCRVQAITSRWGQNRWAERANRRDPKLARRRFDKTPPPDKSDEKLLAEIEQELETGGNLKSNPAGELQPSPWQAATQNSAPKTPEIDSDHASPQT